MIDFQIIHCSHNIRLMKILLSFYSRTLTSVYDAILEDLVFPAEIVGKRIRVKIDGKQIIKVHLDKSQQTNIEHKVSILFSVFYFALAGTYKFINSCLKTFRWPKKC